LYKIIKKVHISTFFIAILIYGINLTAQVKTVRGSQKYMSNPLYRRYIELYKISKTKHADIVMLGNSLTNGGNWEELLGRNSVVNRGIPSDILDGYLARMEYVYKLSPKICFVQGGINDIFNWTPVNLIFEKYKKVIEGLKAHGIIPVIQSTLYVSPIWGEEWLKTHRPDLKPRDVNRDRNREVNKLNNLLRNYATKHGIEYIDLNSKLSKDGFLREDVTWDGAHLKAKGYKIWAEEVTKILRKYNL
jgi:lysophospholipase L1-like esterase